MHDNGWMMRWAHDKATPQKYTSPHSCFPTKASPLHPEISPPSPPTFDPHPSAPRLLPNPPSPLPLPPHAPLTPAAAHSRRAASTR
ncbi:unnamed protein product [Closterium sp. NIES-54]